MELRDYLRRYPANYKPLAEGNLELNVKIYYFLLYERKATEEQFQKALSAFK